MYLTCKKCKSNKLELTSPYDRYPFYCTECKEFLRFDDVQEYKALATNYYQSNIVHLLVLDEKL